MTATDTETSSLSDQYAAIDLGSNSFHLVVARQVQNEFQILDQLGEKVQLGAGLDNNKFLSIEAQKRGLECLSQFAQRTDAIPRECIRIVATDTLRLAENRDEFIEQAESLFQCPVEVISGREEARLVYLGVAHSVADDNAGKRLVIDIGGGSTEFIIGEKFIPQHLESLHMGCVSYTKLFFADKQLSASNFAKAINAAKLELSRISKDYLRLGWQDAVASSGTARALLRLCQLDPSSPQHLTASSLNALKEKLMAFDTIEAIKLESVNTPRARVLPGGLAIMIAIFDMLSLDKLTYSDGALREGILYDMQGRQKHEDVRERTIQSLIERFHVDIEQVASVEKTALFCLNQTAFAGETYQQLIRWSSFLHEIGLTISHSKFQVHGAYLIEHSDLSGFSQPEKLQLAWLVKSHRRKLPLKDLENFRPKRQQVLLVLSMVLRLAVLLNHSRNPAEVVMPSIDFEDENVKLTFPENWLSEHPLTEKNLEMESVYLKAAGIKFKYS